MEATVEADTDAARKGAFKWALEVGHKKVQLEQEGKDIPPSWSVGRRRPQRQADVLAGCGDVACQQDLPTRCRAGRAVARGPRVEWDRGTVEMFRVSGSDITWPRRPIARGKADAPSARRGRRSSGRS
jgi:hypothetical protein